VNIENLKKLRTRVAENSERFAMLDIRFQDACGAVCCLAGHAAALALPDESLLEILDPWEVSKAFLGFDERECGALFNVIHHPSPGVCSGWPVSYREGYDARADRQVDEYMTVQERRDILEARDHNTGLAIRLLDSVIEAEKIWWLP
jgi:hypothetical protein